MNRSQIVILMIAAWLLVGCESTNDPGATSSVLDEDVATAVAGALAEEGGGVADQIADAASLASTAGLQPSLSLADAAYGVEGTGAVDTTYDDVTGWWTAKISRTRMAAGGVYVSFVYREYQYQFLNANGVAQRRFIVNGDTARTVTFKILRGLGYHRTPHRVHRLDSLSGNWVVTNAHLPTVTISGSTNTYYRHGVDTMETAEARRTHDNTLRITTLQIERTRPAMGGIPTVSGTISGTYEATITFLRGEVYRERSVVRDFTVTYSGDESRIGVGGRTFRFDRRFGVYVSG